MRAAACVSLLLLAALPVACSRQIARLEQAFHSQPPAMQLAVNYTPLPAQNPLTGDVVPVHDPSLAQPADGSYVAYTTDLGFAHNAGFLQQRCSRDLLRWERCGAVFPILPGWVTAEYPRVQGIWAPEVSYFGGAFHLYYAVSELGSQRSAIGMATTAALDGAEAHSGWADQGVVLRSQRGGDFNAIDPSLFVEGAGSREQVWLSYGSFWGGIFQQAVDPTTGKLKPGGVRYHLARQPGARNGAIEGASLAEHDGWYYLFASVGICCEIPIERDTYQEVVGRARSVHGPFVAQDGTPMLKGGGTVLLTSDTHWLAPGGGSVWQSPGRDETLMAFHALDRRRNGALDLWVERVAWRDGWPVLEPLR